MPAPFVPSRPVRIVGVGSCLGAPIFGPAAAQGQVTPAAPGGRADPLEDAPRRDAPAASPGEDEGHVLVAVRVAVADFGAQQHDRVIEHGAAIFRSAL